MAEPVPLPTANGTLTPPRNASDAVELPVYQERDDARPIFIPKWRFTVPEIEQIQRHGYVRLLVVNKKHPMVALTSRDPWVGTEKESKPSRPLSNGLIRIMHEELRSRHSTYETAMKGTDVNKYVEACRRFEELDNAMREEGLLI